MTKTLFIEDFANTQSVGEIICYNLEYLARAKGFIKIEARVHVYPKGDTHGMTVSWCVDEQHTSYHDRIAVSSFKDNLFDAYNEVITKLQDTPSIEEQQRDTMLKHMARSVELGKKLGMDIAVINPIIEQMQKISANAITHVKVPELLVKPVPEPEFVGDWAERMGDTPSTIPVPEPLYNDVDDFPF